MDLILNFAKRYELFPAFIGALSALAVVLIKDVIVPQLNQKRSHKERMRSLSERYSLPVAMCAVSLFYRLREMIVYTRYDYLHKEQRTNSFNDYKYKSTVYRLASLIGWMQAIKVEHSNLLQIDAANNTQISEIFSPFEGALADGPHVENDILCQLSHLWSIDLSNVKNDIKNIANKADQIRNKFFNENKPDGGLDPTAIREIADYICESTNQAQITDIIIGNTIDQAINILTPVQRWIYRDWQSAIGELMIKQVTGGIRRFDIIGYAEFEEMIGKNKWIMRLEEVLDGVNFEIKCNDYRVNQLTSILRETSLLIIEINNLQLRAKPVRKDTINHVNAILNTSVGQE